MSTAYAVQVESKRNFLARSAERIADNAAAIAERMDFWAVAEASVGSIFTTVFGVYTVWFAAIGGWLWWLAIPYGVLTLLAFGFTVNAITRIWKPKPVR